MDDLKMDFQTIFVFVFEKGDWLILAETKIKFW